MSAKFANNATSRLTVSLSSSDTTLSVLAGDGAKYPSPTGADWFPLTLLKATGEREIVRCSARSGDAFTILRGQENTAATSFSAGDRVELRMTEGAYESRMGEKLDLTGGTLTGDLNMAVGTKVVFEGSTDDAFETTLDPGNPTDDRTLTFPDKTGTLATTVDVAAAAAASLPVAGGSMTGSINEAKAADVASATAPDIWAGNGNTLHITGATTITGFHAAPQAGATRRLICDAAVPFTAGANMVIAGVLSGATYTADAGDIVDVIADTTTLFRLTVSKITGAAVVNQNIQIDVRHSIQHGPVTGTPAVSDLFPQTQLNRTLAQGAIAVFSAAPTLLSIANGFNSDGSDNNINVLLNTDLAITNLTASATNVIAYDKVNNVLVKTTVLDTDTKGGTPAITAGLYTLDYSGWKMYLGNGTTAPAVQHIILAEIDTDATKIIAIRCRAYKRDFEGAASTPLPGAGAILVQNHNIGTSTRLKSYLEIECITNDSGFLVGDKIISGNGGSNSTYFQPNSITNRKNTVFSVCLSTTPWLQVAPFNSALMILDSSRWKWRFVAKGGY